MNQLCRHLDGLLYIEASQNTVRTFKSGITYLVSFYYWWLSLASIPSQEV